MRTLVRSILLTVACLIATDIYAQPGAGFGPSATGSRISLIAIEPIQVELQLDSEQLKAVKELTEQAEADLKAQQAKGRIAAEKAVGEKYRTLVAEILKPAQRERLDQILVQVAGVNLYRDPQVIEILKLTKQQQMDLDAIEKRIRRANLELPRSGDLAVQMAAQLERHKSEIAAVLTPDQHAELAKLKGPEFDVELVVRILQARRASEQRVIFAGPLTIGKASPEATISLVNYPEVQKELEATGEQVSKLKVLYEAAHAEMQVEVGFPPREFPPTDQSRARSSEWAAKRVKVEREVGVKFKPGLAEVLNDQQVQRLNQIELQAAGIHAYTIPEVVDDLKLSQAQQEIMAALIREYTQQMDQLFNNGRIRSPEQFKEAREKGSELGKALREKLNTTMTPEQLQQFKTMLGPEFDTVTMRTTSRRIERPNP